MEKIELGRTGLQVSRLALGGYPFGGLNRAQGWDPWSTEGRRTAIATINRALDLGINYIDTAPAYGQGNSEEIIGEVMLARRAECVLATKVRWDGLGKAAVIDSVHNSLKRLRTDRIDIVQFHGGMFTETQYKHIVEGGPLEALHDLKQSGLIGHIGITSEEPWTALPFLRHEEIEVHQIAYNFIYQHAARHFLQEADSSGVGVVTMRTMTSGILQRAVRYLAPDWSKTHDIYEVCLKFVLSDSRVHSAIVGMRWPEEVDRNISIFNSFKPAFDFAKLPRMTADVYDAEDTEWSP